MNLQLYIALLLVLIQEEQAIKAEHVGETALLAPIVLGRYRIEASEVTRTAPGGESFWQILAGMVADAAREEAAIAHTPPGQSAQVQPLQIGANYLWSGVGGGPLTVTRVS